MNILRWAGACARALGLPVLLVIGSVVVPSAGASSQEIAVDPVEKFIRHYELVSLDPGALARKAADAETLTIDSPTMRFEVRLEPHDVRAADYRAVETSEDGMMRDVPAVEVRTYEGAAVNFPDSEARFTVEADGVAGMIIAADRTWFVEPFSRYSLAGGPADHVLYDIADLNPDAIDATCATTAAQKVSGAIDFVEDAAKDAASSGFRIVEIATEADDEYVAALGGRDAANAEILSILNQIEGVFEHELGITFRVVLQNTYSGRDPYTKTKDPERLLVQFRDRWNSAMGGVRRSVAHLFTGKDLKGSTVGLAYVGVVCSGPYYAYGLSQRLTVSPAKHILTAHELGHNLNACHSDTTGCNPNPSSCNNTIMQSSVGSGMTFCEESRRQIRAFVATNGSCLRSGASGLIAPTSLEGRTIGSSQVQLTWRDNTTGESGFEVQRKRKGAKWATLTTTRANVTSYRDAGLEPGVKYKYRVRARDGVARSAWSNKARLVMP